jgi:thiol:disulfide interchange protein DsbD
MAFLGGLILNVMPCVLPVISLKLFSLVGSAEKSAGAQRRAGLAFTGGVLASFALLAVGVAVVKASFGSVGWGFQFQSPTYVAALTTIVFAFGLSLFGVFEIPAFGADAAASATDREGLAGSFLFGMFATLLATPCSAPFLGTAVGFAFGQPMPVVFLFLMVIGLGLAAPFLVIAFVPGLFRMLPRPGAWMEVFKQLMGFTLIGTAIWLVDVLAAQVGPDRIVGFLAFLAVIGVGAWVFGRWGGVERTRRDQGLAFAGALAISLVGGWLFLDLDLDESEECDDGALAAAAELSYAEEIPWQRFSGERLAQAAGTPLFIDFTADWCLTCKVNERTVIETEAVRGAMERCGMVALKADWTRRDEEITSWLTRYGKAGVPFYLVVPPTGTDHAIPLPEVITTSSLVSTIEQACG